MESSGLLSRTSRILQTHQGPWTPRMSYPGCCPLPVFLRFASLLGWH